MRTSNYDPKWLVGDEAAEWLKQLAADGPVPVAMRSKLRQALGTTKSESLLELVELRRRGRKKFSRSCRMYFDRRGLEQATDEAIARYKAESVAPGSRVVDLCAGIGGDACALGRSTQLTAVECDLGRARFVRANLAVHECRNFDVRAIRAEEVLLREFDSWHLDPDRRAGHGRTISVDRMQPDIAKWQQWIEVNPHGTIKLAPATRIDPDFARDVECEWIGHHRECQQLLLRTGNQAHYPGCRSATVLSSSSPPWGMNLSTPATLVEQPTKPLPITEEVGDFLMEPHATVIAAGLGGQLAGQCGYAGFASCVAYYTADRECRHPLATCFHVEACLPLRLTRIRAWLREHDAIVREMKKRGVKLDPAAWVGKLPEHGERELTLIATRIGRRSVGILGTRVSPSTSN